MGAIRLRCSVAIGCPRLASMFSRARCMWVAFYAIKMIESGLNADDTAATDSWRPECDRCGLPTPQMMSRLRLD
ncbi:hypothetical protein EMIT0111MI5_270004 [Burkholderia sp. IT-111MI5]